MLARCNDPRFGDARRGVEVGQRVVEVDPKDGYQWYTLGVAHYRAGDIPAAAAALEKAVEVEPAWGEDWFYLTMAHWQLGAQDKARERYAKAVEWMEKRRPGDPEQVRLRAEAAAMLGIKTELNGVPVGPPKE